MELTHFFNDDDRKEVAAELVYRVMSKFSGADEEELEDVIDMLLSKARSALDDGVTVSLDIYSLSPIEDRLSDALHEELSKDDEAKHKEQETYLYASNGRGIRFPEKKVMCKWARNEEYHGKNLLPAVLEYAKECRESTDRHINFLTDVEVSACGDDGRSMEWMLSELLQQAEVAA